LVSSQSDLQPLEAVDDRARRYQIMTEAAENGERGESRDSSTCGNERVSARLEVGMPTRASFGNGAVIHRAVRACQGRRSGL